MYYKIFFNLSYNEKRTQDCFALVLILIVFVHWQLFFCFFFTVGSNVLIYLSTVNLQIMDIYLYFLIYLQLKKPLKFYLTTNTISPHAINNTKLINGAK